MIIQVPELERALKFYGETLGLKVSQRKEHCVGFETGSFQLFVEQGASPGPVFEFLVAYLTAVKQSSLAPGCQVVEENGHVPRLYMHEPYGLTFNVCQS